MPITVEKPIYIYIDHPKLHKHFGHFGNPISGERERERETESERERRKGKRGRRERERAERETEERERIVIPAGCAISRALSRAISSALLSISSCNFLVRLLQGYLPPPPPKKKKRRKKTKNTCASLYLLF